MDEMIYLDASRYNLTAQRTGVENYSYFLIKELAALQPKNITLITPKKIDCQVPQVIIRLPRLWTQIRLSLRILMDRRIKNLFIPSHVMPVIHPKKTTITIHDVAFRRFPESYGKLSRWYLDWGTRFAVKNAKNIIVPSETTKHDLQKFYQADPKKIHVIPLGFQPSEKTQLDHAERVLKTIGLNPKKYFVFIGRIETKKNLRTLISAFERIQSQYPDIKLVLAGKNGRGGTAIIKETKNPSILFTGYISEMEKQVLLSQSLALVFPSFFEGFGLPLLEAMEANTPIIASKIPSTLEIAKGNALFFKPQDAKTLSAHLELLIKNESTCGNLTKNYSNILKKYSWKNCAKRTLEILKLT